jgi:hypothetical protein
LAELCDYRVSMSDDRWMLLAKSTDRCSPSVALSKQRISAGQQISVPAAKDNQLVTMSFTPAEANPLVWLGRIVAKSYHPLMVRVNQQRYRVPRSLAGGPIVLEVPTATRWPAAFGGGTSYKTVTLNEPGTLTFSVITLAE